MTNLHISFLCLFIAVSATLNAQDPPEPKEKRGTMPKGNEEVKEFLKFEVPALINGSKIDPAPVTNLAADFGEERITFKTGAKLFQRSGLPFKTTFTASTYVASDDDVSTILSEGKWVSEYGIALGLNFLFSRNYTALHAGVVNVNRRLCRKEIRRNLRFDVDSIEVEGIAVGDLISHRMHWLAVRTFLDQQNFTLFDTTAAYGELLRDKSLGLGQVYVSYNRYFRSMLPVYRLMNAIYSVGVGHASFTNYKQLDERALLEGTIVYNADSTSFRTIASSTNGRVGDVTVRSGLAVYGELYKDLIVLRNQGAIRLGVRYTHFAPGTTDENSIFSGGFFINTKKKTDKGKNEDSANFSVTVRMDQFQKRNEADYLNNFARILVGVALPLRF